MLVSPSTEELEQLKKAVSIMTEEEKEHADNLTDEHIRKIAVKADTDPANFAIFINGYTLQSKRAQLNRD